MGHQPQRHPQDEPEFEPEDSSQPSQPDDESSREPSRPGPGDLRGRTLAGRYRFDELVGEGTFARVYRVFDEQRGVFLAAKVLRSDIAHEPAFLERFRREAEVLARLQHPNIVRYYDTVESGPYVFILTDYIAGETLQLRLRRQAGPLAPFESLALLQPLAAALHFAHQEGVVHRDLKPANILIAETEGVYVTDFGIARILSDASTLTMDSTVGTPHYMSPEQILNGEITPATDVYAFGVMLYQMYTGQLPFMGDSSEATGATTAVRIVYEHLHVKPVPPTQLNRRLSGAVEDVVMKCLEKDPDQRYASISALYEALTDAIGTPSVSLDAASLAEAVRDVPPAASGAERVPTGVGGLSQVVAQDDYRAADMDLDEIGGVYDYDDGGLDKHKRKPKPDEFGRDLVQGEKGNEKQAEKESDYQEKEQEKGTEKAEAWGELGGGTDRLSQLTFGMFVIWIGVAYLVGLAPIGGWILTGAGTLLLAQVAARLVIPEYRARPGGRFVMGSALLALGLSITFAIGPFWAIMLIAIGVSMLLNHLFDA